MISIHSPFGQRCVNIHDPRIEGAHPSWLPHSEAPSTNSQTDLHIDLKYHRNISSLHQINPLVTNTIWKERNSYLCDWDETLMKTAREDHDTLWWETYAIVCNIEMRKIGNDFIGKAVDTSISNKISSLQQIKSFSEIHRTCIAVLMSYDSLDGVGCTHRNYIYNPRFLVFDKLCMVVSDDV
jgi:hypothetical protein